MIELHIIITVILFNMVTCFYIILIIIIVMYYSHFQFFFFLPKLTPVSPGPAPFEALEEHADKARTASAEHIR